MTGEPELTLAAAVELLPKVELHVHVEGTMRPATVVELAARNGVPLPTSDVTQLYRYSSLDSFLEIFWLVQSTLGSREDWARLGYESVVDAAAHGRVHAETFFTPARHLAAGQTLRDIVGGLAEGVVAGDAETGATTHLICDADRAFGGAAAVQLVEELTELRRTSAPGADRVVGFGMDSTELGVDPLEFVAAFHGAARAGLRLTAHQGEDTPPATIAAVLDGLGAERIDHGLSAMADPQLVARLAAERTPLTVCPTSNVVIANRVPDVALHPLPRMRAAGLLATVNTDDPALTDLDLGREYSVCAEAFGWTWDEVVQVAIDGVEACWLDDDDKRALATRIRAEGAALAARLAVGAPV